MLPLKTQRNSTSVKLRLTDCLAPTTHLHTPSSCSVSGDQHNTPCTHSSQLTCRQHVHTEVHMYACVRARTHTHTHTHTSPIPQPPSLRSHKTYSTRTKCSCHVHFRRWTERRRFLHHNHSQLWTFHHSM